MSSATGTSTKKRKADEISADVESLAEDEVPHLPAPVWGGILDFMPYGEVRSALLVGKHIAVEAAKYVKTISILKPSEMHVPATRRFPNIVKVCIFCLLQGTGEFDGDGDENFTLSLETASSTAPFLAGFPKLEKAFIGGRLKRRLVDEDQEIQAEDENQEIQIHTCYNTIYNIFFSGPNEHAEIFRGLVVSLCGAFKTGLLSPDVTIIGVYAHQWDDVRPCRRSRERTETHSCSWCRNYCKHFPLPHIFRKGLVAPHTNFCLQTREFWETIKSRQGGKQAIQNISEKVLCNELEYRLNQKVFSLRSSNNIPPDVEQHMQNENLSCLRVWWFSRANLLEIDEMIKAGLDPTRIRGEYFRSRLPVEVEKTFPDWNEYAWAESTVKELSSRGFPIDPDSSIVSVDDTM